MGILYVLIRIISKWDWFDRWWFTVHCAARFYKAEIDVSKWGEVARVYNERSDVLHGWRARGRELIHTALAASAVGRVGGWGRQWTNMGWWWRAIHLSLTPWKGSGAYQSRWQSGSHQFITYSSAPCSIFSIISVFRTLDIAFPGTSVKEQNILCF